MLKELLSRACLSQGLFCVIPKSRAFTSATRNLTPGHRFPGRFEVDSRLILHNRCKRFWIERRPAHQRPIDFFLRH